MSDHLCPCQSGQYFHHCCQPYLSGLSLPETPLALMRSRYSAYTLCNAQYLFDTWYFPDKQNSPLLLKSIEESFQRTTWLGLKIINTFDDPANPLQGFVEFMAFFSDDASKRKQVLYERSRFILSHSRWLYVDGIKPNIERNTLCPCGSGKKYKRCCY